MVVGEETPDEGEVSVPNKLAVGYFPSGRGGDEGPVGTRWGDREHPTFAETR